MMYKVKRVISAIRDYLLLRKSSLFDERYYLEKYPDVRAADISALVHYIKFGAAENRRPSLKFDADYYLDKYADVRSASINPLVHYVRYGAKEGRLTNDFFLPVAIDQDEKTASRVIYERELALMKEASKNSNIIILHVYHLEFTGDLLAKISKLKEVDVAVTCRPQIYHALDAVLKETGCCYKLFCMENSGYDILPFITLLEPIQKAGYKRFIKLHAKRDHPDKAVAHIWRESLVNDLIGTDELKESIFKCLDQSEVNIVGSAVNYLSYRYTKYQNKLHVNRIANFFGVTLSEKDDWGFFAGTMFAGCVDDFQIFNNQSLLAYLSAESLPLESGTESSPYHALERLFCLLVARRPQAIACVDYDLSNEKECTLISLSPEPLMASAKLRYFHYKNKLNLRKIKLLELAGVSDPWWCYREYNVMDIVDFNVCERFINGEIKYLSAAHKNGTVSIEFQDGEIKVRSGSDTKVIGLSHNLLSRNICYKDLQLTAAKQSYEGEIKVSVICQTYNHAKYIDQAIRSMVMQETDFKYEIIIGDDCSTDNSADLIQVWADQYPEKIVFVRRESNIGGKENFKDLLKRSRGKYIALNEGDDFWTDNNKLQRQFDYLESQPECTVCFHQVEVIDEGRPDFKGKFPGNIKGDILIVEDFFDRNYIQTNSVMYRRSPRTQYELHKELMPADWFRHILHVIDGEAHLLPDVMSVYRRHAAGMWSSLADPTAKWGLNQIVFFNELNELTANYFHNSTSGKVYGLFRNKFWDAFAKNDQAFLLKLVNINPSLSRYFFSRNGIAVPEQHVFRTTDDLVDFFKSQFSIDVVVTAYNHEGCLAQALDSILAQQGMFTMRILVSDDCSSDATSSVVRCYAENHSDLIVDISPDTNLGMLRNMEHAFSYLQSDFTAICEGDDYWVSDLKLQKQLSNLLKNREFSMCFNLVLLDYPDKDQKFAHPGQEKIASDSIDFKYILNTAVTANFSCCFYRTENIKRIPQTYFERKNVADWLFNLYMASFGRVGYIPELLSAYRVHSGGQWSGLTRDEQRARKQSSYKLYLELFPEHSGDIAALIDSN